MAVEKKKTATVRLPRAEGYNANQDEFFSVNFHNYIIKRGERVEVPEELAELIENNERAIDFALDYAEQMSQKQPEH